jgi:hypothetical protein
MTSVWRESERAVTYHRLTNIQILGLVAVALPVYYLLSPYGREVRGFVGALCICAIGSIIMILRDLSKLPMFWACVTLMFFVHAAFVVLVPWGGRIAFGILAVPVVVADMYVSAKLIILATRRGRTS